MSVVMVLGGVLVFYHLDFAALQQGYAIAFPVFHFIVNRAQCPIIFIYLRLSSLLFIA